MIVSYEFELSHVSMEIYSRFIHKHRKFMRSKQNIYAKRTKQTFSWGMQVSFKHTITKMFGFINVTRFNIAIERISRELLEYSIQVLLTNINLFFYSLLENWDYFEGKKMTRIIKYVSSNTHIDTQPKFLSPYANLDLFLYKKTIF